MLAVRSYNDLLLGVLLQTSAMDVVCRYPDEVSVVGVDIWWLPCVVVCPLSSWEFVLFGLLQAPEFFGWIPLARNQTAPNMPPGTKLFYPDNDGESVPIKDPDIELVSSNTDCSIRLPSCSVLSLGLSHL